MTSTLGGVVGVVRTSLLQFTQPYEGTRDSGQLPWQSSRINRWILPGEVDMVFSRTSPPGSRAQSTLG